MGIVKDAKTVGKIVVTVAGLFAFSSLEQKELDNFAKQNMSQWIEQMKDEEEVRQIISQKAKIISK